METAFLEEPEEVEDAVVMSFADVLPLDFDAPEIIDAPVAEDWVPVTLEATAPLEMTASIELIAPIEGAVALEAAPDTVSPTVAPPVAPPVAPKKDKRRRPRKAAAPTSRVCSTRTSAASRHCSRSSIGSSTASTMSRRNPIPTHRWRPTNDMWKRIRSTEGTNVIEAALITPLLLAVTFAVIDFGTIFYAFLALENGVSHGDALRRHRLPGCWPEPRGIHQEGHAGCDAHADDR